MSNFPNMNPMVMPPPPPPPPPKPMEMDPHSGMMPPMMDTYNEDMMNMGVAVEGFPPMAAPHMVGGYVPQPPLGPPPPQVPMVPTMAVPPQSMVLPPQLGMLQNLNFQTADDNRHLIDPYLAAEISSIVHTLSTSQLVYVLAALKKFLKHAPSEARRFLLNNPQLTYALLHTQFILGEHDESVLPLSKIDQDISHVNKLERSMHLKPFHNLYEDQGVPPQMPSYPAPPVYPTHEQIMHQPPPMVPEMESYPAQRGHAPKPRQPGSQEATQSDIEELVNQGIYPASAALVDEVIKNPEILTKDGIMAYGTKTTGVINKTKTMDVTEFPLSPFHGESVKFHFDSDPHQLVGKFKSSEGSLGLFHFAYGSEEEPSEDKEVEYSVESLSYFPKTFFSTPSALLQLAKNGKFAAGLMDKLEAFSTTDKGDLLAEVVVGVGKKPEFLSTDVTSVASTVASVVSTHKLKTAVFLLDHFTDHYVELFLTSLLVHLSPDNRFKKDTKNEQFLENVVVVHPSGNALSFLEKKVKVLGESVNLARELVSAPPNYANSVALSKFLKKRLTNLGLKVDVLDPEDCKKLGMFCFLSVGQGSKYPQKFVHAVYEPDGPVHKTLAFVGKGITFDSGGYNTKSAASQIHLMKFDMGGFSAVFGAANALAKLNPKNVKVHFVSALCENMVDKNSYRPGDVYQASNGKTVEVLNTDAEGRVTLADSLGYAAKLEPDYLLDYATLTGAQVVALGNKCAAYYSNDEELAELYRNAARSGGELAWRMPLLKEYKEFLKSKLADLANVNFNAKAGSVNAALFLKEFVGKTKWVHVDMAGPVWDYKAERGTGYGVLSMVNFTLLFA